MYFFFSFTFIIRLFVVILLLNTPQVTKVTKFNAMNKVKEPVRLRKKRLSNGNDSLYLDIYRNGKREYEFLKLYLTNGTSSAAKQKDKETLQFAQSIKAKRIVELQNGEYGFLDKFKIETNFLDYYMAFMETKINSAGNYGNWKSAYMLLQKYAKKTTTFKDIDAPFLNGWRQFLEKAKTKSDKLLSQNTKHSYFCKVVACINHAHNQRIIPYNPCIGIEYPKAGEPQREYLTVEEVRALVKAECKYPVLKQAFLFSCLTGLRWSDIQKLTWSEVQKMNGQTRIVFRQKKTKGFEYLDISDQAVALLGDRRNPEDRVFIGLKYSAWHNLELSKWCIRAGITRNITFHSARHTFAVMMLDLGTEIYTVSKLLGHKELKTTQIYAKVLDKKKQEAVSKIPNILTGD